MLKHRVTQAKLPQLIALCASLAYLGLGAGARAQGLDDASAPKQTPNYVTDDMLLNADKDASNWLLYGRDYATTRYALQTEISQNNVKKLVPKWELSFGVLDGQDSQAVAVNGTVYVTSSYNRVWALDGRTGEIKWKYERELPADVFPELCCDVVNRGVAVYGNKVYLATLDAHLVALDNATGKVVWDKQLGDYTYAETFTIMPMALRGKIILGTSGAEYGVRGWIEAVNADTGEQVWKTYTIPPPANRALRPGAANRTSTAAAPPGSPAPTMPKATRSSGQSAIRDQTSTAMSVRATTSIQTARWRSIPTLAR